MDLSVTFAGVRMRSPIGVAPHAVFAPPGIDPEREAALLLRYVDWGAGYVYTPVIRQEPSHPAGMLPTGSFQLGGCYLGTHGLYALADRERIQMRLRAGLTLIEILKKRLPPDVPVIANVTVTESDPRKWASHAKDVERAGADLIELNPSCPLGSSRDTDIRMEDIVIAPSLADSPVELCEIIDAVSREVSVPVGLKASPEVGYPRFVNAANAFSRSGLRFITEINSPLGIGPPDVEKGGVGRYPGVTDNPFAGILGPWIRYLCYRNTAAISKYVPSLDVGAAGGLTEPKHVVEVMMLGAKLVELSSGIFFRGVRFITECLIFLREFMRKHGYESVEQIRGLGLRYVTPVSRVTWPLGRLVPTLIAEKCKGCGICAENLCFAMNMNGRFPSVSFADCGGCGLCAAVCPAGALEMVPVAEQNQISNER